MRMLRTDFQRVLGKINTHPSRRCRTLPDSVTNVIQIFGRRYPVRGSAWRVAMDPFARVFPAIASIFIVGDVAGGLVALLRSARRDWMEMKRTWSVEVIGGD